MTGRTTMVTLSRRNLLTLLSKLDRQKAGEDTYCMLTKPAEPTRGDGYITDVDTHVCVVEDELYYANRRAGYVNPKDLPALNKED